MEDDDRRESFLFHSRHDRRGAPETPVAAVFALVARAPHARSSVAVVTRCRRPFGFFYFYYFVTSVSTSVTRISRQRIIDDGRRRFAVDTRAVNNATVPPTGGTRVWCNPGPRRRHGRRELPPEDPPGPAVGARHPVHFVSATVVENRRSRGPRRPGFRRRRRLGVHQVTIYAKGCGEPTALVLTGWLGVPKMAPEQIDFF